MFTSLNINMLCLSVQVSAVYFLSRQLKRKLIKAIEKIY